MKVNIKKYPSWVGPYQVAEFILKPFKKKDCDLFDEEYPEWCQKIIDWYVESYIGTLNAHLAERYSAWRESRRVSVRIDKCDTWSMDNTLAHIILPMLKQLQETKHGSPLVADVDVPKGLRSTKVNDTDEYDTDKYDTDINHHLRWDWVLNEMIWTFEQKSRDDWGSDYYEYEYDAESTEGLGFGLKLVREDHKGREAHQKRMAEGFKLFGKYYEALWD